MKPVEKPGYARGVEVVQNVGSVKGQIVSGRSRQISLASQYATHDRINDLPVTRILNADRPPQKRAGPGTFITVFASACVGLFLECCMCRPLTGTAAARACANEKCARRAATGVLSLPWSGDSLRCCVCCSQIRSCDLSTGGDCICVAGVCAGRKRTGSRISAFRFSVGVKLGSFSTSVPDEPAT